MICDQAFGSAPADSQIVEQLCSIVLNATRLGLARKQLAGNSKFLQAITAALAGSPLDQQQHLLQAVRNILITAKVCGLSI